MKSVINALPPDIHGLNFGDLNPKMELEKERQTPTKDLTKVHAEF